MFNNGTTYAGRSSPILHTLLNVSGRKRHSLFHVKLYTLLKTQDREKGVPSEYLRFLVFCLIQNRQKPHELFHPLCFCSIHILFGGSQQFPDRFAFSL